MNQKASRRSYRWPGAAREMVRAYLNTPSKESGQEAHRTQASLKGLITRIAAVSGNPRSACWRFVRQSGVISKRSYRPWTKAEQQRLLDLIASRSLEEVTVVLRRSPTSVRALLHRLGPALAWVRIGSRNTPWPKRCTFVRKKCRSGLIVDYCIAEPSRQAGSSDRLLAQKTCAISASGT